MSPATIAWLLVVYVAFNAIWTVALTGRSVEITPSFNVGTLIISALKVWAVLAILAAT
jgi:hypothetical protein